MNRFVYITLFVAFILGVAGVNAEITEVGYYDTEGEAHGVVVVGDFAFVADRYDGMVVIDVSDKENPDVVGICDTGNDDAARITVVDRYAYLLDHGLWIIDISDLEDPEAVGYYETRHYDRGISVLGDYAYLAHSRDGLIIIDVSDPENPDEIGVFDAPDETYDVVVVGDYAYLTGTADEGHLIVLNISDPENPDEIGYCGMEDRPVCIAFTNDYLFISRHGSGMITIDISDPENPELVCDVETDGDTWGIDVKGDYAFVSDDVVGLVVVDISDPENTEIVETFETAGEAVDVAVSGNYAYVAAVEAGLRILDVTEFIVQGPSIFVSAETLDFGEVDFGTSMDSSVIIRNRGIENLIISNILIEGDYFISNFEERLVLEPDEEYELVVTFSPEEPGEFEGEIVIESNDPENEETIIDAFGIGINSPPLVEIPIGDIDVNEDAGLVEVALLDTVFSDPNGEELVFSAFGIDELGININDEDVLTIEPVLNFNTPDGDPVIIIATDGFDATSSDTLLVIVTPLNDPPEVCQHIEDMTIEEDPDPRYVEVADLDTIFHDFDNDQLHFGVNLNDVPDELNISIENMTNILQFRPEDNFNIDFSEIIVTASDLEEEISDTFNLSINPVNDAPTSFDLISPNDRYFVEPDIYQIEFSWENTEDIDGDDILYNLRFEIVCNEIDTTCCNIDSLEITELIVDLDSLFRSEELVVDSTEERVAPAWWVEASDGELITESNTRRVFFIFLPNFIQCDEEELPKEYCLSPIYPNPFNAVTRISYSVPTPSHVRLAIYDISGRMVGIMVDETVSAGRYVCEFDGGDLSAGLYFIRLGAGGDVLTRKVVMVK